MNYTFILLSGGSGSRMQQSLSKQYMLLVDKPMIMHVLEKVDTIEEIEKIIIVCAKEDCPFLDRMLTHYGITKPVEYAKAGKSRQASVLSGLKKVETDQVIIHEAARPFVKVEDYKELIDCPEENAMMGTAIPFTVLKGHENIEGILTRSELVNVQLPQKFNTRLLLGSHERAAKENRQFTEDASLVFYYHPEIPIKIIQGREYNLKITTHMDLLIGQVIYNEILRKETDADKVVIE